MTNSNPIDKNLYLPAAILIAAFVVGGSLVYNANMQRGSNSSFGASVTDSNPPPVVQGSRVEFTVTENDHIRGNPSAEITLVEFSDLQCPFCQRFHPTAQQALQEYGDKIRWVYKHFPLDNIHPEASPAAEAAECVWEQKGDEAFWTFTDRVFEDQDRIGSALYREIAGNLGVNLAQFDTCVSQRKYKDKVAQDYQQGIQAGVTGTPGSFVNGVPVKGAVPYEVLKSVIEEELKK